MPYLFISYSREDRVPVKRLCERLSHEHGVAVWRDDDALYVGDSLPEQIAAAIRGCDALAALLSPRSVVSEWVAKEIDYARLLGKPVIGIQIEDFPRKDTPFQIASDLLADFRGSEPSPRELRRALESLARFGFEPIRIPAGAERSAPMLGSRVLDEHRYLKCDRHDVWQRLEPRMYDGRSWLLWALGDASQGHLWLMRRVEKYLPTPAQEREFVRVKFDSPHGPLARADALDALREALQLGTADLPRIGDALRRKLDRGALVLMHWPPIQPGSDPTDHAIVHYYREWLPALVESAIADEEQRARLKVVQPVQWARHGAPGSPLSTMLSRLNPFAAAYIERRRARALLGALGSGTPFWQGVLDLPEMTDIRRSHVLEFARDELARPDPEAFAEAVMKGAHTSDEVFRNLRAQLVGEVA